MPAQRATPTEHTVARIFREAGATVRKNLFLKDTNVEVGAEDARQTEVPAQDLPCFGREQLAVDITLRRALSCEGEAHPHAADTDGVLLKECAGRQRDVTHELATSGRCKLVVMATETGGRKSDEAAQTIRLLSRAKAREAPSYVRCPVVLMWERWWTRVLSVTCATAFAASLIEPAEHDPWRRTGGETPLLADLFESDPR